MKPPSLRRRLIIILLGLIIMTWGLAVGLTAVYAAQTVERQIDRLLAHYTDLTHHTFRTIQSNPVVQDYFREQDQPFELAPELTRLMGFGSRGEDQATNIWFGRNQYLVGKHSPRFPVPVKEGALTSELGGVPWRILYRREDKSDVWLAVGVNLDNVDSVGVVSLWRMVLPLIIFLPVVLVVLLWGINRGLRPVRFLADRITTRTPDALEPIEDDGVPREILPIVQSLNDLLRKLQRALASEKRFTSNAAHELQTPLTAIQAETQGLQRQFNDAVTQGMLSRISVRVNRATETLRQLLTLARLDPDQDFEREEIDLNELLMDEIAEVGNLAIERCIEFKFEGFSRSVFVRGNREWLRILVRNLLLNALRHSTPASTVEVAIDYEETGVALSIANDCEPIPQMEFERLTERFYRCGNSSCEGVGLGLSIARRIAELHDAQLHLAPWQHLRGFLVKVIFSVEFR